jgi:hypothetical protein
MPQSEDKLALELLQCEINVLFETIQMLENRVETYNAKLQVLLDRKKSMENYLNSDNN